MTDGSGIILLIEDDADEVVLTQKAFDKAMVRHKVVVLQDGQEALDWLFRCGRYDNREPAERPSLILLDLKLPLVSGLDVLKAIRANGSTSLVPVTVLTSSTEPNDQREAYRLGATEYVRKPTSFSDFVETVRQIKLRWLDVDPPAGAMPA